MRSIRCVRKSLTGTMLLTICRHVIRFGWLYSATSRRVIESPSTRFQDDADSDSVVRSTPSVLRRIRPSESYAPTHSRMIVLLKSSPQVRGAWPVKSQNASRNER
jgi:hypothetical protein